jgi:hypothetical protein
MFGALLILLVGSNSGFSQMSPDLKQFLESRSFPELINTYKRDHISLFTEGKRAKIIAARPYTVEKGYRCQVFAGTQKENAENAADKIRALQLDSVYVIYSDADGLYKVQVGNFDNRRDAEILLDKLRYAKVQGAWVVETDVHLPKSPEERQEYEAEQIKQQEIEQQPGFYYAIQVFATSDSLKAYQLKDVLDKDLNQPVDVINHESTWKVLVGKFPDRSSAEEYLRVLKRERFGDAWITQVVISG